MQDRDRVLLLEGDTPTRILVLDDIEVQDDYDAALAVAFKLLGTAEFAYSPTIRCEHTEDEMSIECLRTVVSRCAVWTNIISDNRLVILATKRGMDQLKVGADKSEGDIFRVGKLGVVLCIPALITLNLELPAYRERARRVLREAGLLK